MREAINNKKSAPIWYVQSSDIHGCGVFAAKLIPKGTWVAKVADARWHWWTSITPFGSMVNHQTRANCELRRSADRSYWLCTVRSVPRGAELVSDYKKAPWPFSRRTRGFREY